MKLSEKEVSMIRMCIVDSLWKYKEQLDKTEMENQIEYYKRQIREHHELHSKFVDEANRIMEEFYEG